MPSPTPAPVASLREHYERAPLRAYVRHRSLLGHAGTLMELGQPAGAYASPPTDELVLVQPRLTGIGLRKVWGVGRFDGIAPTRSLWLVPPRTATDLTVRTRHVISTLSINAEWLRGALPDRAAPPDFGRLCAGPFFSRFADHVAEAVWAAADIDGDSRLHLDALLQALVAEFARLGGERPAPAKGGLAPWQIRRVTEAIGAEPAASLSLATLAALVGLSPFHFARAFRASLGVPPHRYQKRLRIERAAALLEQGRLSVTEAALAVGYESSQALSRAFRQETGASPGAWQQARHG